MRIQSAQVFALSAALLLPTHAALACACCADNGERWIGYRDIEPYDREELSLIRSAETAHVYTTACWLECVEGIDAPQDDYGLELSISPDGLTWDFQLKGATAEASGSIQLVLPDQMFEMSIDQAPDAEASMPKLYKEWRFDVVTTGAGAFKAGLDRQPEAELILHGGGNRCTSVADFDHWTLDVVGEGVEFRLYGSLIGQ